MDYYEKMKPIFIQFCKDAFLHKCKIIIDCNHIPPCILSIEDMKIIERVCESSIGDFCDPVIDITMDGKATSCFGVYNPVDIYQFNNVTELDRFLFVT